MLCGVKNRRKTGCSIYSNMLFTSSMLFTSRTIWLLFTFEYSIFTIQYTTQKYSVTLHNKYPIIYILFCTDSILYYTTITIYGTIQQKATTFNTIMDYTICIIIGRIHTKYIHTYIHIYIIFILFLLSSVQFSSVLSN